MTGLESASFVLSLPVCWGGREVCSRCCWAVVPPIAEAAAELFLLAEKIFVTGVSVVPAISVHLGLLFWLLLWEHVERVEAGKWLVELAQYDTHRA